ncbi:MAG TPA: CRTAC1 family protein, partial [Armatimonadota bacterium]|nr:CRTAC1 family protein [Armatimonadota bacterium]
AGLVAWRNAPQPSRARPASTPPPAGWFEDQARHAGITFRLGHHGKTPLTVLETMGTGCATADLDGDGHADLLLVGQQETGNTGRCALYRGDGKGSFADVTPGSGLETPGLYMGCAVADVDNDGKPDLLVTGYGVCRLFRNLGGMRFRDITDGSGLAALSPTDWCTSAAFGDVDRDGKLDLYIGRYVVFNEHTLQFCDYGGVKASCGPKFYDPQFGRLYRNTGGGRFQDWTQKWGLGSQQGKCLGAAFADVNGDGWPDLYIGNDEMPGDLFINRQGKGFTNEGLSAGVALSSDSQMQGAMGVDFGDFNRDGRPDLFVTTFEQEPVSLYANRGNTLFEHVSLSMGLDQTRSMVGFGTRFVDLDNDGWPDLPVANGHIHDNQSQVDRLSSYPQPMQLFMNRKGTFMDDRSREAGPGFTTPMVGRGLAVADFDEDGRPDLLVMDLEGTPRLLMNRMPETGNWLRVRLEGTRSNRSGIGAKVTVVAGPERWTAEAAAGGSYLSTSDPRLHFGLGAAKQVDRVEVRWPSGKVSTLARPAVGGEVRIREPQ